ncbi:MAG: phasin family protein [Variibacter sp.]
MAKGPTESFEIPGDLRSIAEQSVAQARQAFDGFMTAVHKAASKVEEQAATAQAGAKGTGEKVMSFAERNVAASFDFAERLARAKDVQEMLKLQTEFAQAQMQALSEQARELGQTAANAAKKSAS